MTRDNPSTPMKDRLALKCADIVSFSCDVLVLKFAQDFYGADEEVAQKLRDAPAHGVAPKPGDFLIVPTGGKVSAHEVLFVGVAPLHQFSYEQIREFAARSLRILSDSARQVEHIAMTVHGVNYGLDERECFLAQIAGILDAFQANYFAAKFATITIVDKNRSRVSRLSKILRENLPPEFSGGHDSSRPTKALVDAGRRSQSKPHVFVAMPFSDEMEDVYIFGIQEPVNEAGFLCERVDMSTYTGDILERIKSRIETAALVIADLTGANPNVYLEVGYAWGKNRRTLLLAKNSDELKFDVQSQRTLIYRNITELAKKLRADLTALK